GRSIDNGDWGPSTGGGLPHEPGRYDVKFRPLGPHREDLEVEEAPVLGATLRCNAWKTLRAATCSATSWTRKIEAPATAAMRLAATVPMSVPSMPSPVSEPRKASRATPPKIANP